MMGAHLEFYLKNERKTKFRQLRVKQINSFVLSILDATRGQTKAIATNQSLTGLCTKKHVRVSLRMTESFVKDDLTPAGKDALRDRFNPICL